MKLQYFRAFIVLIAGLVTLIVNIKTNQDVTKSLFIVLVVLIVFYFIGTLICEIMERLGDNKNPTDLEIVRDDEEDEMETEEVHVSFDDDEEEETE